MRPLRLRAVATTTLSALMLAGPMLTAVTRPAAAQFVVGVGLHINIAPPILPVYEPPPLPGPGYIFQPGYWAYGDDGYYWVPGTWVEPPQPGLLWTPGYWGWNNGVYVFNGGYWGPHVGYYGGISYGFGYNGLGFFGGEWRGGVFAYNRAAFGVGFGFGGVRETNVYNTTIVHVNETHVAFNGPGGVSIRPTPAQEAFAHERHVPPTPMQTRNLQAAAHDPRLRLSANHGVPAVAAVAHPGEFHGPGAVPARAAPAEARRPEEAHPAAAQAHPAGGEARPAHEAPVAHPAHEAPMARPAHEAPMARPAHEAATPHVYAPHAPVQTHERAAAPRPEAARPEPRPMAAPHPMAAPRPEARPAPRREEHPKR